MPCLEERQSACTTTFYLTNQKETLKMKLNELMDGDLVFDKKTKQPRKISGTNDLLFHDDYDPIPLGKKILVKNGFVKTWNGDWQLKEYSTIIISKDYYVKIFERSIRIDYVHELQHLLHAACVEKEIAID